MTLTQGITALVVLVTYGFVALGRVPRLAMSRATITLVGAAILVATGALTQKQALDSIDMATLLLLGALMVVNRNLQLAGFFGLVGFRVLSIARTPRVLLALVIVASGVLSALFLNDPICLLFTPLVVDMTLKLKRDPIPYLIGLATAANVGSTATITGNPQNLIIGNASGIPYLTFLAHLGPVALIGLLICWIVIVVTYPREFRDALSPIDLPPPRSFPPLLKRTAFAVVAMLVAFLVGLPVASSAAFVAGALLISRLKAHKLLALDWDLLAFFAGLFVVTGAIEVSGLSDHLFVVFAPVIQGGVAPLSLVTGVLSNVISNVPAVLLLRTPVAHLPNTQQAWLTLAMSSTLAGNLTLLGSAANLIVAEVAARRGVKLTFGAYLRAGVPITILTILVGILWLSLTMR